MPHWYRVELHRMSGIFKGDATIETGRDYDTFAGAWERAEDCGAVFGGPRVRELRRLLAPLLAHEMVFPCVDSRFYVRIRISKTLE